MTPREQPAPGERAYRVLLRLYPKRFRDRYGADMLAFYRERVRTEHVLRVWLQAVPDIAGSALGERFAWLHHEIDRAPAIARTYSHRREDTMSILLQDIRYAARSMARRPAFTAIVLATLALGIGANAAIFTVVNAVLLRPLPFAHPDRMVDLTQADPHLSVSEPEFVDYQRGISAFEKLAAYSTTSLTISGDVGDPVRSYAARISRDFFDVTGSKPELGRVFTADEFSPSTHARVTVLGHRLWVQQFSADAHIVGKTIQMNGTRFTVVGVMPAGFTFPDVDASLWIPWRMNPDSLWTRNNHYLRLVGLLAPHATVAQARAQAHVLDARWMAEYPQWYAPNQPVVAELTPIRDYLLGPTRPYMLALIGAVGFILLIACVNVANLLLVRGDSRRKEVAIRTALGASSNRIIRQLLTESMLLALVGAALGALLAWAGVRVLTVLAPSDLPRIEQVGVDARVVAFTAVVTVITGLLFGVFPALRARRFGAAETLREGGKTSVQGASGIARRTLVVAEIMLAVMMLTGAGLLIRSLVKLQATDLGFDSANLMTMQVTVPPRGYTDTTTEQLIRQIVDRVSRLPGVAAAGAVGSLPISGSDDGWSIVVDGHVVNTIAEAPSAKPEQVTPGYFHAMSIRLLSGRGFTAQDRMGVPPVAVISEGMARKLWPGVNPIGHTLRMFGSASPWVTIVGVVADVRSRGFQKDVPPTMYFPYAQCATSAYYMPGSMTIVVRASTHAASLAAPMRAIVRSLDPLVAISRVATMDDIVGDSIASRRFTTVLLGAFAALALVLAGIGIYGVVSYGVSQRTYEIGVRMAMGATPRAILRLVLGEGAQMTGIGLVLGLFGALVVDRWLRALLVGVSDNDAFTLASVTVMLAIVAACACVLPARRATAVSPTEALRDG